MIRAILTARTLRTVSAVALAVIVFFASVFAQVTSLRFLVVAVGSLALLVELLFSHLSPRRKAAIAFATALYLLGSTLLIEFVATAIDDRLFAVNAGHLFVVLPVFGALGWFVYQAGAWRQYVPVVLAVGSLVAGLAVIESVFGVSVVGRDYEFLIGQREGSTRAMVAAENSLVLGALLAAMVPLTLVLRRPWLRVGVAVLLIAGVWASGSRAPAVLCAAVAVVQFIPVLRRLLQRSVWLVQALAAAAVLALGWLSIMVWRPYIPGDTGLEYSSNYRGALYSTIPELVREQPLGYLLRSAPPGTWTVESELHGPFDITRSLDSEVAFAAFGLGWLGIILFLAALFLSLSTIRVDVVLGLSASTLTALGFVLALHGWDGMSVLWYALIGACLFRARVRLRARRTRPPRVGTASVEAP